MQQIMFKKVKVEYYILKLERTQNPFDFSFE